MAEHETSTVRAANLARIRDNQRRSRARRKEYLQELETKWEGCKQTGMEASAEIQAAARRVAEENKRLRQLLKQRGMSDAEIDGFISDRPDNPQYPTATSMLEDMIGQRRACGDGSSCGGERSSSDLDDKALSAGLIGGTSDPHSQPVQPAQSTKQVQQVQQVQHQPQSLTFRYASPHSSSPSSVPTPSNANFNMPQMSQYGLSQAAQPDYNLGYNDWAWQDQYPASEPADFGNVSSCYVAADAIRMIKPEIGAELETELGCSDGKDCNVPNTQIFTIMDRYSAAG